MNITYFRTFLSKLRNPSPVIHGHNIYLWSVVVLDDITWTLQLFDNRILVVTPLINMGHFSWVIVFFFYTFNIFINEYSKFTASNISFDTLCDMLSIYKTRRAIQFLHDLGTVQFFDNEFLREYIVINPQWIVDVMACVVSIKDSPIKVRLKYVGFISIYQICKHTYCIPSN